MGIFKESIHSHWGISVKKRLLSEKKSFIRIALIVFPISCTVYRCWRSPETQVGQFTFSAVFAAVSYRSHLYSQMIWDYIPLWYLGQTLTPVFHCYVAMAEHFKNTATFSTKQWLVLWPEAARMFWTNLNRCAGWKKRDFQGATCSDPDSWIKPTFLF